MISQPTVRGDPVFLGVILSNLLENALKYSPAGSKVTVTLDARQGEAILVFENEQGDAGMPNPEMVFKRHYRSDGAQGVAGSGLGLYICASLVRAQNGNISYKPKENRIRFIVSFPCAT
jgi:signal transduction histidine kinase